MATLAFISVPSCFEYRKSLLRNTGRGKKYEVGTAFMYNTTTKLYAPYAGMIRIRFQGLGKHPTLSPSIRTPLCLFAVYALFLFLSRQGLMRFPCYLSMLLMF